MRVLAAFSLVAASATIAHAQRQDSARTLTPVKVTGHRAPTTIGGAGVVAARVDSLPTPPAPTLDVALRRLPFVSVRTNSRGESELSIRGSESRTPAVLLDGLPVTLGWDSRTDPSLIPLTGATTLRVTRAMNSVLAGPNAVGGVVEIDAARTPVLQRALGISSGIDDLGSAVVAGHYEAPISNGVGLRVGGAYRDRPALALPGDIVDPDAPEGERINSDAKQLDGFAHLRYARANGMYVTAGLSAYDAERGVQPEMNVPVEDQRLWRYPNQSRTFGTLGIGSGVRTTPWGAMTVDASLGMNSGKSEINVFTDRTYSVLDGTEKGDERTIVGRLVAAHSLPGNATLRVGGTFAAVRYLETLDDNPATKYAQNLSTIGVETDIPMGRHFGISAGFGFDKAENPETGGRTQSSDPKDDWAGRLGMTANVGSTRLHAAASQRSRFPALRELYSGALGRFTPNPDLRPERLTTIEAGATVTRGALQVQGTVFRQVNEDGVIRVTLDNNQFMRVNRDEIRSTGFEAVGVWSRGNVSVIGDLLAQKVRVYDITAGNAENRPENVPELRATLGLVVPTFARINANAWVSHSGSQYCESGQTEVKGDTRIDLGADRTWSFVRGMLREVKLLVSVDNIADATVFDQCGMPQPGRTLRAGVALR